MKKIKTRTLSKLEKTKIFGGNDTNDPPDGVSKIARTCGGEEAAPVSMATNYMGFCY